MITILIDILHTTPQARLHTLRVPPEDPHNRCPAHSRKYRPCILLQLVRQLHAADNPCRGLNQYPGQRKHDTGEDVDDDLLVHRRNLAGAGGAPAKDEVAT